MLPNEVVGSTDQYMTLDGGSGTRRARARAFIYLKASPGREIERGQPTEFRVDELTEYGSNPTLVNHVETLSNFPHVLARALTASGRWARRSREGFQAIGSGIGSAGFIVYDDTACMVDAAYRFSRFLSIESCGQCPPCKLGSSAIAEHLERIETGTGTDHDLGEIARWLEHVTDASRCYLATEELVVVSSILRAFSEELADHIASGKCPHPRRPTPELVDLTGGHAHHGESLWSKQLDWTYTLSEKDVDR